MSAVPVDEDKLMVILQKAAIKAEEHKQQMQEFVTLVNQVQGIRMRKNNEMPESALTRKPISKEFREMVYKDVLAAATRLGIIV